LVEDIKDECSKFGHILSLKIPRPMMGLAVPGLGKIFIEYTGVDEAKEAKKVNLFI
jgi:splicing factor U2AF 65 kDa subunit